MTRRREPSHRPRELIEDYQAVEVINRALTKTGLQMNHVRLPTKAEMAAWSEAEAVADARGGNFQLLEQLERENTLGPEGRALLAARRRGEFKARRGTYRRKRGMSTVNMNYVIALQLRFFQQLVQQHYPTVRVILPDVIAWAAQVYGVNKRNLANFCRGPHRPRGDEMARHCDAMWRMLAAYGERLLSSRNTQ